MNMFNVGDVVVDNSGMVYIVIALPKNPREYKCQYQVMNVVTNLITRINNNFIVKLNEDIRYDPNWVKSIITSIECGIDGKLNEYEVYVFMEKVIPRDIVRAANTARIISHIEFDQMETRWSKSICQTIGIDNYEAIYEYIRDAYNTLKEYGSILAW